MLIEYLEDGNLAVANGYKFRRDMKTGYFLASKAIGGKRKRLHVYVWETENGVVPTGYHVHHKDGNKNNNAVENLCIMTAGEHEKYHADNWDSVRAEKMRKNIVAHAMPAAKMWHGTDEGKQWHKEHAKAVFGTLIPKMRECTYCGKQFVTKDVAHAAGNHFCSNKCKAAYRRDSGVDDVEKTCAECGLPFIANKYATGKRCPVCKSKKCRV